LPTTGRVPHDVEAPVESDMLLAVHLLEPR
jgi:hypothetical protein